MRRRAARRPFAAALALTHRAGPLLTVAALALAPPLSGAALALAVARRAAAAGRPARGGSSIRRLAPGEAVASHHLRVVHQTLRTRGRSRHPVGGALGIVLRKIRGGAPGLRPAPVGLAARRGREARSVTRAAGPRPVEDRRRGLMGDVGRFSAGRAEVLVI